MMSHASLVVAPPPAEKTNLLGTEVDHGLVTRPPARTLK
jgi:hypothetical protein